MKKLEANKNYKETLAIYDYILAHPDDFSKAPAALFLKGFTYDEYLKNYDEAKKYYTDFLEKYPEDKYAESAKSSLKNLGKTLKGSLFSLPFGNGKKLITICLLLI